MQRAPLFHTISAHAARTTHAQNPSACSLGTVLLCPGSMYGASIRGIHLQASKTKLLMRCVVGCGCCRRTG